MQTVSRCKPLLGTYVEVTLTGQLPRLTLLEMCDRAFQSIERIQSCMSFHDPDSELSRINHHALSAPPLQLLNISHDMRYVLKEALDISQKTQGMFDITTASTLVAEKLLPQHHYDLTQASGTWEDIQLTDTAIAFKKPVLIDLGGIAKGYAVDHAFNDIIASDHANVLHNVSVNAGGDIRHNQWQKEPHHTCEKHLVHIKACDAKGKAKVITCPMYQSAVATSSNYYFKEPSGCIIEPKTTTRCQKKHSVSVFAPTCLQADALTKVAMLANHNLSELMSHWQNITVLQGSDLAYSDATYNTSKQEPNLLANA